MLLAYVDESYDTDRYWIAALICPEEVIAPLTQSLDRVVAKAASAYRGVDSHAELHGHDLFQAKHDWAALATMTRARIGVYSDAFQAIASFDVAILIRGVHIPRLNDRYVYPDHPHAVVLTHLLERIDERAHRLGEPALVIADEVDQADQYRRSLWHFQRYATDGYRARRLRNIVDTIHFAPSRASRLVQAVDLIAFLHRRITATTDPTTRSARANAALWEQVSRKVKHRHCWWP